MKLSEELESIFAKTGIYKAKEVDRCYLILQHQFIMADFAML